MAESFIRAIERTEKPNKVRRNGFVPGIIYGKGLVSESVKFDEKLLKKFLKGHIRNAKINVKMGEEIKKCIIKEIQKDPITGQILHIGLQTVNENDIIHLKVPVVFNGLECLAERQQLLQVFISEVEIMGQASNIPELVSVNVENKKLGDKVYVKDIEVKPGIKIMEDEEEILAVVTVAKEYDIAS